MVLPRDYYPTYDHGCNPIHAVRNWAYVRKIIRAVRRGEVVNPILITGSLRGGSMLTGTHRSAANDILAKLGDTARVEVWSVEELELTEEQQIAVDEHDYEALDFFFDKE